MGFGHKRVDCVWSACGLREHSVRTRRAECQVSRVCTHHEMLLAIRGGLIGPRSTRLRRMLYSTHNGSEREAEHAKIGRPDRRLAGFAEVEECY